MLIRRILYLLLVCFITVFLIITGAYYLLVTLFLILMLPIISLLAMYLNSSSLMIQFNYQNGYFLDIHSKGLFPLGRVMNQYEIYNPFYNTRLVQTISFMVGEKHFQVPLECFDNKMGNIQIISHQCKLIDMLGLFSKTIKIDSSLERLIIPTCSEGIYFDVNQIQTLINQYKSDDYEIKEYKEGDSLKDIHYKISYKMHKRMIKDRFKEGYSIFEIFVDLSGNEDECEQVMKTFIELSRYLISIHAAFHVFWKSHDVIKENEIKDRMDIEETIKMMLSHYKAENAKEVHTDIMITSQGICGGEN